VNNVFLSAAAGTSPTIQFAIPVSSGQILLNKNNWVTSPDSELGRGQAPPTAQLSQILPTYTEATATTGTSTPGQPTMLPLQSAGVALSAANRQPPAPPKALSIKLETPMPVSLSSPVTTNCATPTVQQQR